MTTAEKAKVIAGIKRTLKIHELRLEFAGSNNWRVASGGKTYRLQAFFAGYDLRAAHGCRIAADCECEAARFNRECTHALKVKQAYENNPRYLFPLFGMEIPQPLSFGQLWKKARTVAERLEANRYRAAEAA